MTTVRPLASLSLIAALFVGCASPRLVVSRESYPTWPFIPDSAELHCDNGSAENTGRQFVTIEFPGSSVQYALNGSARDLGAPELDSTVWNGDRAATLGLIEQGLALCA